MDVGKIIKETTIEPLVEPVPPGKVPEPAPERVTEPDREKVPA